MRRQSILSVLVAFDGSPASWSALDQAIDIARSERARLTIAGLVRDPPFTTCGAPVDVALPATWACEDAIEQMERELATARRSAPPTVSITTRILRGRPSRTIAALQRHEHFDVVMVGHTRRRPLRGLVACGDATPTPRR
jgi:nucleotide-binding universal stress UspA family protein